jgi:hypothetical protein
MYYQSNRKTCVIVILIIAAMTMPSAWAWGPLIVTGPGATQQGQPYRWNLNPIPYRTDLGLLGSQTNAQANAIVATAFQAWQSVSTANVGLLASGQLTRDITSSTFNSFYNSLLNCSDASQPSLAIVYDVDGSIITAMGGDSNSTLGLTETLCVDTQNGYITRGWSIMNGRFIDGQPNTQNHQTVTLDQFKTVFTHEFGHLLGLDHSQLNINCLTSTCSADDLAGVPMMFPILLDGVSGTLKTDDIAAISTLYPNSIFAATTGRIQGSVLFSDGITPAQGYNVIARKVGDPRKTAVACVSGFLFTAASGNTLVPLVGGTRNDNYSSYGSRDQALLGFYDIPGLPPGQYSVEVEAINNSGEIPFIESSSVGPIGGFYSYQYKIPGTASNLALTVGSGSIVNTNTNVIFLGTPQRYDAWEDGP